MVHQGKRYGCSQSPREYRGPGKRLWLKEKAACGHYLIPRGTAGPCGRLFHYPVTWCNRDTMKPIFPQPSQTVQRLRLMPYDQYLQTPYWRAVSAWMRAKFKKCEHPGCNVPSWRCQVHHLTYERRGCELQTDLQVLCERHHKKVHRVLRNAPKSRKRSLVASLRSIGHDVREYLDPHIQVKDLPVYSDSLGCYEDYLKANKVSGEEVQKVVKLRRKTDAIYRRMKRKYEV